MTVLNFILYNKKKKKNRINIYLFFSKMPRNLNAERDNPCLKEQDLTYKCLNTYNFDREKCEVYFANYNNCKEFWNKVRSERRSRGIVPYLPEVDDREAIKAEYMKTKPKP